MSMTTGLAYDDLQAISAAAHDTENAIRDGSALLLGMHRDTPLAGKRLAELRSLVLRAQLQVTMTSAGVSALSAQLRQATDDERSRS